MDWPILLGLGCMLIAFALYAWRARPHAPVNQWFCVQTLVLACWIIGIGGTHSAHLPELWGRWTFASASLMPATFLRFTTVFGGVAKWPSPRMLNAIILVGLVFAFFSATTPWIARDFVITTQGLKRNAGPLMPFFTLYFVTCAVMILTLLGYKWRGARGRTRAQLQYYGLGLFILTTGGITTNLVAPAILGHSSYSTMGPYFTLPLVALLGHAIIRHRLLDIPLIFSRGVAFAAVIVIVSSAVYLGVEHFVFAADVSDVPVPITALVAFVTTAALMSQPLAPWVAHLIDRYFQRGRPDLTRALHEASRTLSRALTLEAISRELRRSLESTLVPETILIVTDPAITPEPDSGSEDLEIHDGAELSAVAWAVPRQPSSVRILDDDSRAASELQRLREAGFEVFIELGRVGQRTGVILLGPRRTGAAYLASAVGFLEDLAEIASLALDTALLHKRHLTLERDRERLAHLARMGRSYAELAHELRTPITTIANLTAALPDRIDDPEYRDLLTRLVPAEVNRIAQLTDRLRAFGRDNDTPMTIIPLVKLLDDITAMTTDAAGRRSVRLKNEYSTQHLFVYGDANKLTQLFSNLLTNALDASPKEASVVIRAEGEGERTIVQIVDQGRGIDPEIAKTLFEPFVTTKATGLGLGLSICRDIANAHGATLSLRSRTDHRGAVAEVIFPAAPEPHANASTAAIQSTMLAATRAKGAEAPPELRGAESPESH